MPLLGSVFNDLEVQERFHWLGRVLNITGILQMFLVGKLKPLAEERSFGHLGKM